MTIHAFPSGHNPKTGMIEQGMTLRDYFAAAVLQGIVAKMLVDSYPSDLEKHLTYDNYLLISTAAYEIADSMMERRQA